MRNWKSENGRWLQAAGYQKQHIIIYVQLAVDSLLITPFVPNYKSFQKFWRVKIFQV